MSYMLSYCCMKKYFTWFEVFLIGQSADNIIELDKDMLDGFFEEHIWCFRFILVRLSQTGD